MSFVVIGFGGLTKFIEVWGRRCSLYFVSFVVMERQERHRNDDAKKRNNERMQKDPSLQTTLLDELKVVKQAARACLVFFSVFDRACR